MKNVKRLLAVVLVLMFAFTMFTGCGAKPEEQAATTQAAESTAPAESTAEAPASTAAAEPGKAELPLTKDKVTFSIWLGFNPQVAAFQKTMADNAAIQELEKLTNVHLEWQEVHPSQQVEKWNLAIASDEYPDLVIALGNLYQGGYDKAISDGVAVKLNDYIDKYAPNLKALMATNPQAVKSMVTDTGNIGAFPAFMVNMQGEDYGAVVRKDWLDADGLKAPVTYDDYYNMLKAFKEKNGATGAFLMGAGIAPQFGCLAGGYGINAANQTDPFLATSFFQVDGKVKFGLAEPGYKEFVGMLAKWYSEGLIYKDYMKNNFPWPDEQAVLTNKSGLFYMDQGLLTSYEKKSTTPGFKLTAVQDAVKQAGDVVHLGRDTSPIAGGGISVTSKCKNVELATKYIDFMYTEQGAMLCNYGVEGVSYNMVDGKPKYTEVITNNPDGINPRLAIYKFALEQGAFKSDAGRYLQVYPQVDADAAKIWSTNKDGAYALPMSLSMTPEEASDYSKTIIDINTFATENVNQFITGKKPMAEYDAFLEQMKSMGLDKTITIQQAALDRYNKR